MNSSLRIPIVSAMIAASSAACVKEDPVITGKREAGAPAPVKLTAVPLPDPPDEDAPDCRKCGETLNPNTARGTLCRKNKSPSSVQLLSAVVDCACRERCTVECSSYCSGSQQEPQCSDCILKECKDEVSACQLD